jgi:hypothetical protein
MNIMWWIVDCSITKEDVIKRVGKEKYEWYYPLYELTKKIAKNFHFIQKFRLMWKIKKNRKMKTH